MKQRLKNFFTKLEHIPISPGVFVVTFFVCILARLSLDQFIGGFQSRGVLLTYFTFLEFSLSFALMLLVVSVLLSWGARTKLYRVLPIALLGMIGILVPPLWDYYLTGGGSFQGFYIFDDIRGLMMRYLTFFGDGAHYNITYGMRLQIALMILLTVVYTWIKTGKKIRSFLVGVYAYSVCFFVGTMPSWVGILVHFVENGTLFITEIQLVQYFARSLYFFGSQQSEFAVAALVRVDMVYSLLLPLIFFFVMWIYYRQATRVFVANARFPQLIYHAGLFVVGALLAVIFAQRILVLDSFSFVALGVVFIAIALSWFASVVANDLFDTNIDTVSNAHRPLIVGIISREKYAFIGWMFFACSLVAASTISMRLVGFLLIYHILAWLYNAPPFRLKRFPIIASSVASLASLMIVFAGFSIIASPQELGKIPAAVLWLLFMGYAIALPLKDFKDIDGDKNDGVVTLPIWLGEQRSRLVIAMGIFLCYIATPWILREKGLFFWAFLFGSLSFWSIVSSRFSQKLRLERDRLLLAILLWVTLFGLVSIWVLWR